MSESCTICKRPVRAMTFYRTGVCSDLCMKVKNSQLSFEEAEAQR